MQFRHFRYPFVELYTFKEGLKSAFFKFSEDMSLKNYAILVGVRKTDPFCGNPIPSKYNLLTVFP